MSKLFDAADLENLLEACGNDDVTLGTTTVKGLVDRSGESVLEEGGAGAITGTRMFVYVRTGALPGLEPGATITVNGCERKVRDHREVEGGDFTRIEAAESL